MLIQASFLRQQWLVIFTTLDVEVVSSNNLTDLHRTGSCWEKFWQQGHGGVRNVNGGKEKVMAKRKTKEDGARENDEILHTGKSEFRDVAAKSGTKCACRRRS